VTKVQTATGPVEHDQLGVTLSHEHLFIHSTGLQHQYPWLYDRESAIEHVTLELRDAAEAGVGTIVDVTTPDLGRDVEMIAEASRRSGVHVIVASGIWLEIPRMFRPRWDGRGGADADQAAAIFTHEIEQGAAGSSIRAGVIKVANNRPPGVGELEETILRGAARAARRTGVPISTHTSPYDVGREQMRVFAEEDVPPRLVAIGHAFTDDLDYLRAVLEAGHYLSIDHFGRGREEEPAVLDAVATLAAEGHADHLMLSHDNGGEMDWRPHGPHEPPSTWRYVPERGRAELTRRGVATSDIDAMLIHSPAAFLSGGRADGREG
jgi:phosphotriesterase-related protein